MQINNYQLIIIIYKIIIFLYQIRLLRFIINQCISRNLKNYIKEKIFFVELNSINFFKKKYLKYCTSNKKIKNSIFIEVYSLRPNSYGGIRRVTSEIVERFKNDSILNTKYKIKFFIFDNFYFNFKIIDINSFTEKKKFVFKEIIYPKKKDKVLLLGNDIINITKYRKHLFFLKQNGVKFYTLIYDILPFLKPIWFDVPNYKQLFKRFILSLVFSHTILTISKKVKFDLLKNFNQYFRNIYIIPIKLGADFSQKKKLICPIKKNNKKNLINFLIVGTLEPRKGHLDIIKTFNHLFLENNNLTLHIVGKKGWKYNQILKSLEESVFYNTNLFYHEDLDDGELNKIYINSDIIIVPSFDEGFGLPIIEALNYKKLVIARDIPVFREQAQKNLYYFPDKKINDIKNFFANFIFKYQKNKIKIRTISAHKWDNTYRQIKNICNI
jgi:glycosyltransferase involved in cell wall biosynthesis